MDAVNPSPNSETATWQEVYCARYDRTPAQFRGGVFWRTLHRHALPVAPLLLLTGHFDADRQLIANCARARSMRQIREEIEDHRYHPVNRGWLRRQLALRVSTQRLREMAREYLPGSNLPPPISPSAR